MDFSLGVEENVVVRTGFISFLQTTRDWMMLDMNAAIFFVTGFLDNVILNNLVFNLSTFGAVLFCSLFCVVLLFVVLWDDLLLLW